MLDSVFKQALKWEQEKGLSNDPDDKGGITNDGITWTHYYELCYKVLGHEPTLSGFKMLTESEVRAFYMYAWTGINVDKIENPAVAAVCFDFALNSAFGKREIQRALKAMGFYVNADNVFGPVTIAMLNTVTEKVGAQKLVNVIMDRRENYLQSLVRKDSSQKKFLKGWLNRCDDWRRFAAKLLSEK